ncbi:hypothetical protein FQR65_LT07300 [Abscondita terminalis]|nr:hypothetical protein FQR65_LT07300 [Abscondita terminalis]
MGSEKVTKTLGLDGMKRCLFDDRIAWLGGIVCTAINSTKTFDYLKQPSETFKTSSCQPTVCPEKEEAQVETMEEVRPPTKTRQRLSRKRNRNKKRKKQRTVVASEDVEMKTAECETPRPQGGDCDVVDSCWLPKFNFRCRLPSECESEDSFIVFDDSTDNCYKINSVKPESDSDGGDDECTYMYHSDVTSDDSPTKKVRFANPDQLCEVHPMVQWSYAYRNARKGPWEQYALDRMRFQNRINNSKPVLEYVLQPAHRNEIYKDRFMDG